MMETIRSFTPTLDALDSMESLPEPYKPTPEFYGNVGNKLREQGYGGLKVLDGNMVAIDKDGQMTSMPDGIVSPTPIGGQETNIPFTAISALSRSDIGFATDEDKKSYYKNVGNVLRGAGYDGVTVIGGKKYAKKNGVIYPMDQSFVDSMVSGMLGDAGEVTGSVTGAYQGMKMVPSPHPMAKLTGAVAGGALGSVVGNMLDQFRNNLVLDEDISIEQRGNEMLKAGVIGAGAEVGGTLLGKGISKAITPLSDVSRATMNATKELFGKHGVEATPATLTGSRTLQSFEEWMSKGSWLGQSVAKMKQNEIEGIENVAKDLLDNKMGAKGDPYISGSEVAKEVTERNELGSEFFNNAYSDLMKQAGTTVIPANIVRNTARAVIKEAENTPALNNEAVAYAKSILDSPDSMTYEMYQKLRSTIGAKIKDSSVTGQSGSKETYKQLYRAINDDFDAVFANTPLGEVKTKLDNAFKEWYKEPFESGFAKSVVGAGNRAKTDAEKIGGRIARSTENAKTGIKTADSGFYRVPAGEVSYHAHGTPKKTMSAAADFILNKSTAPDGSLSLAKTRTNLKNATGVDELLRRNDYSLLRPDKLKPMKDDIVSMIEQSGKNRSVANKSGTAWMSEMMSMKREPVKAIIGSVVDLGLSSVYRTKLFQKWLTNDIISEPMYRELIEASARVGTHTGARQESSLEKIGL